MKYGIDPQKLYNATHEAPALIKSSDPSMKRGRMSGFIAGYPAPLFIKLGTASNAKIVYMGQALIDYLDQFDQQQSTTPSCL